MDTEQQLPIGLSAKRVDVLFYNSYIKIQKYYFVILLIKLFLMLLPWGITIYFFTQDNNENNNQNRIYGIQVSIGTTISFFHILMYYVTVIKNKRTAIALAESLGHTLQQQSNDPFVSEEIYDITNNIRVDDIVMTQQIKNKAQKYMANVIKGLYKSINPCLMRIQNLMETYLLAVFIQGIIFAVKDMGSLFFNIIFILLCGLSCFKLILGCFFAVLILGLSPLICFGFCVYCCCCANRPANYKIPEPKRASMSMLLDTNQCSICLRNFQMNDNLITLSCSNKHIFHEFCINTWARMNPTCPICRTPLTE